MNTTTIEFLRSCPDTTNVWPARRQVGMEFEVCPDVLTFYYKGAQFFAVILPDGSKLRLDTTNLTVLGTISVGDKTAFCQILDPHICAPIVLTAQGEALEFEADRRENEPFDQGYPRHRLCGGSLDTTRISETHHAIVCRKCHLRVVLPLQVRSVEDLRTWSKQTFPEAP